MTNQTCRPLLLERAAAWCGVKLKEYRVPVLAGMLFGVLAYMFAFTNKLVNHDDVFTLFFKGGSYSLGRWGLEILELIFPNYSMPWIYGIITIALFTVSSCVIIRIFSIRSKLLQVLLTGSILTFPSLIGTFTYMFTSSSYAVSFLLAVIAVLWVQKQDKKWILPALVCMIGSLSIYQSYVAVAASLLVLILIQRLMQGDDVADVVKSGIFDLLFLIVSLGLYYAATMVINRLRGSGFNSYANGNLSFSFTAIPANIVLAYRSFLRFFTEGFRGLIPTAFSRAVHYILLAVMAVLLVLWLVSQKKTRVSHIVWILLLLGILPLAINCMYLFTTEDSVHTLVLYGFVAVYVLAAVLADACISMVSGEKSREVFQQIALNVLGFCLAAVIACNTYIANESYLLLHLRYENAYSFYTSLVADIKMTPGFDENTKLAVIGTYQEPDYYLEQFPFSDHITGTDGFLPDIYSKDRFVEYYLGFPIPFASDEEIAVIAASDEYAEMAVYPYYGSLKLIGDTLVVKLS